MSDTKAFSGTVPASTSQPGGGAENTRKPIGNAKTRKTFQPASRMMQPLITGISDSTSIISTSCERPTIIIASPDSRIVQPANGAGEMAMSLSA